MPSKNLGDEFAYVKPEILRGTLEARWGNDSRCRKICPRVIERCPMNLRKLAVDGYHRLMQIRDTPHAIAGGMAIGVLIGFTPLLGLKTLLGMAIAWLFRCSKLAAVVGVTLHDILWLIWPVILRFQYRWGFWILHGHRPPRLEMKHFQIEDWLHWKTLTILWPMFVGSIVMALPLAIASYFVALKFVTKYQSKIKKLVPHE